MIRPPFIVQQAVDYVFAASLRGILQKRMDFFFGRCYADGVERHSTEEGKIVCQRSRFEAFHVKLWPYGTIVDPPSNQSDLFLRKPLSFRRHHDAFVMRCDAIDDRACVGIARNDCWSIRLSSLQDRSSLVDLQSSLSLNALVTVVATFLQ